jgi:hypothetical protein
LACVENGTKTKIIESKSRTFTTLPEIIYLYYLRKLANNVF